jgi:hypothetical protein
VARRAGSIRKAKVPAAAKVHGRDLELLTIIERREVPNGEPVEITVYDRIISYMRGGADAEEAALAAGVTKGSIDRWRREGAEAEKRLAAIQSGVAKGRLTQNERVLVAFARDAMAAHAGHLVRLAGVATKAAVGELDDDVTVTEKVTQVRDAQGNVTDERVVDRTTKRTTKGPDTGMVKWLLESRYGWKPGEKVEHTGPGGGPVQIDVRAALGRIAGRIAEERTAMGLPSGAAALPAGDDGVVDAEVVPPEGFCGHDDGTGAAECRLPPGHGGDHLPARVRAITSPA